MMDFWNHLFTQSPIIGWLGYVHGTRPSRKECKLKHEKVDEVQNSLCTKIDNLHTDVREIRTLIIAHIANNNNNKT